MSGFSAWLAGFSKTYLAWFMNAAIDLIQASFDGLVAFALTILALFPASTPIPTYTSGAHDTWWSTVLGALNWVLPIGYLSACVTYVTGAIVAYLIIAPVARWLKLLT